MEFTKILPEQSSVKVVLNGGHQELDDATIPFTMGFDESIAKREPTHVLVIDFSDWYATENNIYSLSASGERRIYELNAINYIQFHRPGCHRLVFILFHNMTRGQKKTILQKGSLRSYYENKIYLDNAARTQLNTVGYCEDLVEIPQHFFAVAPKTGLKKHWHTWVNRWFLTRPVDECEFRKRAILASTVQPIVWMLSFLLRLIPALVLMIGCSVLVTLALLCGQQAELIVWKNIGSIGWDFLFLYPRQGWADTFDLINQYSDETDYMKIKHYKIGKLEFKVPISLGGLAIQLIGWGYFVTYIISYFQNWHNLSGEAEPLVRSLIVGSLVTVDLALILDTMPYEKVQKWAKEKFREKYPKTVYGYLWKVWFISLLAFLITQPQWGVILNVITQITLSWVIVIILIGLAATLFFSGKKIFKFISKNLSKLHRQFDETIPGKALKKAILANRERCRNIGTVPKPVLKQTYADWLGENMNINYLPTKVDVTKVIAPTKAKEKVLRFRVSFWRLKSKVCRPYVD